VGDGYFYTLSAVAQSLAAIRELIYFDILKSLKGMILYKQKGKKVIYE